MYRLHRGNCPKTQYQRLQRSNRYFPVFRSYHEDGLTVNYSFQKDILRIISSSLMVFNSNDIKLHETEHMK